MNFIPQEDTYKRKSPGLNGSVSGDFILYFFHESSPTGPLTNRLKIFSYLVAIVPRYSVMDLTPQIKMWYFVIHPPPVFLQVQSTKRGRGGHLGAGPGPPTTSTRCPNWKSADLMTGTKDLLNPHETGQHCTVWWGGGEAYPASKPLTASTDAIS